MVNACLADGRNRTARAVATPLSPGDPTRLTVRFNVLARGKYFILHVDPDYRHAVVGTPDREYLWFLSRDRSMSGETLAGIARDRPEPGLRRVPGCARWTSPARPDAGLGLDMGRAMDRDIVGRKPPTREAAMPRLLPHLLGMCLILSAAPALAGQDVLDLWDSAAAPAAPEAKPVALDPASTVLLVLDIEEATCNAERRPPLPGHRGPHRRAGREVPGKGRGRGLQHHQAGHAGHGAPPGQGPARGALRAVHGGQVPGYPGWRSCSRSARPRRSWWWGTAAHGAVLHTATAAAQRGYAVVLPVDGLSAETPFIEKAAVWLLLEGPATKGKVAVTRCALVGWKE